MNDHTQKTLRTLTKRRLFCGAILDTERIQLIRAEAGLANAVARQSLQEFENSRLLSASKLSELVAAERLRAFEQAESENAIQQLSGDVALMQNTLDLVREEYERTQDFAAMGFRSFAEFASAGATLNNTQRAADRAKGRLYLTRQYEHPRSRVQLNALSQITSADVSHTDLQNDLFLSISQLTRLQMERTLAAVQGHVDYLTRAIEACTMYAPKSGEVVYCHRRDEGKYIEVGQSVYYTQNLLRIADRRRMAVAGRVSDRQVNELQEGLPVDVQLPTIPGRQFSGTLTWIAPIASAPEWFRPYDRQHQVQIILHEDSGSLRMLSPGDTAVAQIVVQDRADVLQIPVAAVFRHEDGYAVIMQTDAGPSLSRIRLGESNDRYVEVISGLPPAGKVVIGDQFALKSLARTLPPCPAIVGETLVAGD